MWTGETETFENGDVKSVKCHRFQSKSEQLSEMTDGLVMITHGQSQVLVLVVFIVFKPFCVDRWKQYENASVDETILLRFAEMKMDTFENALKWMET